MTAEVLRNRDTRCSTEVCTHGICDNKRWGTAWHCEPHDYKQLVNSQRNAALGFDKKGFRDGKERNTI